MMTTAPKNTTSPATGPSDEVFRVGPWTVHRDLHRLSSGDKSHTLEPKVLQVLLYLAERPGQVAPRSALMDAVWPDTHVGDDPLNRAISELRKIFGDDPRQPRYIETIHKKGYRLVAEVRTIPSGAGGIDGRPAGGSAGRSWIRPLTLALALTAAILALILLSQIFGRERRAEVHPTQLRAIPVTSYPGREGRPALAPSGPRVALSWSGPDRDNLDIYIKQSNSEQPLRLTTHPSPDLDPVWSPDGTAIAFIRHTASRCEVRAVPAIGGPERTLYTCTGASVLGLDWSPDGESLVVADQPSTGEPFRLILVSLDTRVQRFLTQPAADQADLIPRFSPDGKTVAFLRTLGRSACEVFLVPSTGGEARQLTFDGQDVSGLDWTVDGESLVVSSNRNGVFGLWRLATYGAKPLRWIGYEDAYLPSVGAHGLAFERRSQDVSIWRQPLPGAGDKESPTPWIASTRMDFEPRLSPDGSRIAFISRRSGSDELWISDAGGGQTIQLTTSDKPGAAWPPSLHHPRWSPDGQSLVYATRQGESFDIETVSIDGAFRKVIVEGPAEDRAPCWDPSGRLISFVSDRGGADQLWQVSIEEGNTRLLAEFEVRPTLACPNAGEIYYRRRADAEIRRLSLGPEGVTEDKPTGLSPATPDWTATSGGLYAFLKEGPSGLALVHFDPETGTIGWRLPFWEHRPASVLTAEAAGLSVSDDGLWAFYTGVEENESDIFLVEGFR